MELKNYPLTLFIFAICWSFFACKNEPPQPRGGINGKVIITGTQVGVEGANISISGPKTGSISTGIDGNYSFLELPTGTYSLTIKVPPSFRSEAPKTVLVNVNQVTTQDIPLIPKGEIVGTILEAGTINPILGALVELTGGRTNVSLSTSTGNNGKYSFDRLSDGSYELFASHPDYTNVKREITITSGESIPADISMSKRATNPLLSISPSNLDFGSNETTKSIEIENQGGGTLTWNITGQGSEFTISPSSGSLGSNEGISIDIRLDRKGLDCNTYEYPLDIQSNNGSQSLLIRYLVGNGSGHPNSSFSLNPEKCFSSCNTCVAPCLVQFTNQSQNAEAYSWNFGDGGTSSLESPIYTYQNAGKFEVILDAIQASCLESSTDSITILPNSVVPNLIFVEGGSFNMGSNEGNPDELPIHTVTVNSFELSETEITFNQYDFFCEQTNREKPDDEGWGRNNRPVINVSWFDAIEYCTWLSTQTGDNYRLPTEAEWEYAAGGGVPNPTNWAGTNDESTLSAYAFYNVSLVDQPQPVRRLTPNALGLYDMSGNVFEWCQDWYGADYYQVSPRQNPIGPSSGLDRVYRGGNWGGSASDQRVANRSGIRPSTKGGFIGFRILREL